MRAVAVALLLCGLSANAGSSETGVVISADNDEKFVIETSWGKQKFEAQTYCFGIDVGDSVVFQESTAVCVSNSFIVKGSDRKCEVWCE